MILHRLSGWVCALTGAVLGVFAVYWRGRSQGALQERENAKKHANESAARGRDAVVDELESSLGTDSAGLAERVRERTNDWRGL